MKADVIREIEKYIDDELFEPGAHWPEYYYNKRAYSIWAAEEIIRAIKASNETPRKVVEDFVHKMENFAEYNWGSKASEIFMTAKEAGEGIINILL